MPFFAARPYAERRYSEATEILDTDYEADYSDDESPRRSLDSVSQSALNSCSFQQILTLYMKFGYGSSHTSLSTPDLPTPDTASRGVFDQQLDKTVQGPTGPHLFRSSIASSIYARSTEIPLYIETSPVQTRFPQAQAEYESPKWEQRRHTFSPQTPKAFTSLQSAVCQLDENQSGAGRRYKLQIGCATMALNMRLLRSSLSTTYPVQSSSTSRMRTSRSWTSNPLVSATS